MKFCRYCLLLSFTLVVSFISLHSQEIQKDDRIPVFQSKVRVVVVDVVVTNGKDKPVSGLIKDDFEILEDGHRQNISYFEEHKVQVSAPVKLPPMPQHVYTNYPTVVTTDAVNVLLLDWLNTKPADQAYVRAQVINYLKEVAPGTRLAVFILGDHLRMVQGVTTDSEALLATFVSKKADTSPLVSNLSPGQDPWMIVASPQKPQEAVALEQSVASGSTEFTTASRIKATLDALQQLAHYLTQIPGRKHLLWFSGSFPITLFPTADTKTTHAMGPYQRELQHTSDLLTPSQVAIYPIAAQGVVGQTLYEADHANPPSTKELQDAESTRATNQIAMEELARDTGGKAYYNTNGLSDAITHAIDEGARYYTLTYSPSNRQMDAKFRKIQVKLLGDNYQLSYRQGYYADDLPMQSGGNSEGDLLTPLMVHGMPAATQIIYKVEVAPTDPQPSKESAIAGGNTKLRRPVTRYTVDFAVAVQDIKMETTSDGVRHGNIQVALIVYNRDGAPVNWIIEKNQLSFEPKAYAEAERVGLQLHLGVDVPHGDIYLNTGIYDVESRRAGTLEIPLSISNTGGG
jgi:VWFA-related protein